MPQKSISLLLWICTNAAFGMTCTTYSNLVTNQPDNLNKLHKETDKVIVEIKDFHILFSMTIKHMKKAVPDKQKHEQRLQVLQLFRWNSTYIQYFCMISSSSDKQGSNLLHKFSYQTYPSEDFSLQIYKKIFTTFMILCRHFPSVNMAIYRACQYNFKNTRLLHE